MKSFNQLVRHDGNKDLFRAVQMSLVAMANGHPFHIHAQGLRGTGKTSILRSVKSALQPIVRIKGCIYNCLPTAPHCPEHRDLSFQAIATIGTELIPCPFWEISHSAKIGTIVGSIDLSKLTDSTQPMAALLPGTIPQAHRGIIFIDEINRLVDTSPEIADVLLDVMGTKPGRIQVEETGLPMVELPVAVTIWAASNPDEEPGALVHVRKQLADRFDLVVNMGRPSDYDAVKAILYHKKDEFLAVNEKHMALEYQRDLAQIVADDMIKDTFARIYVDFGLESLRAVEAMETAAGLAALLSGRKNIIVSDIMETVPLVLGHRTDSINLGNIMRYLDNLNGKKSIVTRDIAIETAVGLSSTSHQEEFQSISWWQKLWRVLSEKFKMRHGSKQQNKYNTNRVQPQMTGNQVADSQQADNSLACNASSNVTSTSVKVQQESRIIDPTEAEILAPPRQAVPLAELSVEQFVMSEERKTHG